MVNISNKKRHQQFGFKLLLIALIIGVVFTVWYFYQKNSVNTETDKSSVSTKTQAEITITGR